METSQAQNTKTGVRQRICWTQGEVNDVCAALITIVIQDRSLSCVAAVHKAEEAVLPPSRRRLKNSIALYTNGAKAIRAAYDAAFHQKTAPVVPSPEPIPVAEPTIEQVKAPAFAEPPQADPWVVFAGLVVAVGKNLVERLDRIESALIARIGPPPGWRTPVATPTPPAHKAKHKTIAIVGLHKDQFEHVREKVAHLPYSLVWVDKEDKHVRFPLADYGIVQRHVSHAWYDKARSICPSFFVEGAISGVVQKVFDIHSMNKTA